MNPFPKYFAGSLYVEEDAVGGFGDSPDEAINDYLANHAESEIDYLYIDDETGTIVVEVFSVEEPDEEDIDDWDFAIGMPIEKRTFDWKREPDPDYPGCEQITYTERKK